MKRFVTSAVGMLIMIPICFFSHTVLWPFAVTVLCVIATEEMLSCIGVKKSYFFSIPSRIFSLFPMLCWILSVRLQWMDPYRCIFLFSVLYFAVMQVISVFTENRFPTEKLYASIALVLYVVLSMTAIAQIRFINYGNEEGKYIYLLVFFGGWISDTFAFFTGRLFGKTKLCPSISPKKTVEGSIGGVLANMIGFAGYALVLRLYFDVDANVFFFAILGALFSAVGQFGDLFASGIKRYYKIKDFGKLFPGHGGVLDRFDSTLSIAMVMLLLDAAFRSGFLIG